MNQIVTEDVVVCRCFKVRASTIRDCVQYLGAESIHDIKTQCGAGGGCMACRGRIQCLLTKSVQGESTTA